MTSASRFCPYCGSTNPPDYKFCESCHHELPDGPSAPRSPTSSSDLGSSPYAWVTADSLERRSLDVGPRAGGLVFVYVGAPFLILAIILLIGAGLFASGNSSYNQACSTMPNCTPAPDFSGALVAGGVLLLLIGLVFVIYGASQYGKS